MARLDLAAADRATVRFLIASHLEMSTTLQRRDIFDPETVREFAGKIETSERLKMLSLLTYADIKSVNPEALTPWKTELLWRLYAATANYLARSLDKERVKPAAATASPAEKILPLLAAFGDPRRSRSFPRGVPAAILGHPFAGGDCAALSVGWTAWRGACPSRPENPGQSPRAHRHHPGPAVSLCFNYGVACGLGDEHCEGRRFCQCCGGGSGHFQVRGPLSHSGIEPFGGGPPEVEPD